MNVAWVTETLTTPVMGGLGKILPQSSRDLTSVNKSIYQSVYLLTTIDKIILKSALKQQCCAGQRGTIVV